MRLHHRDAAPIIIAEAYWIPLLTRSSATQQTVLELDGSPFMTVLHRAGGAGVDYAPADGDLLIAVL